MWKKCKVVMLATNQKAKKDDICLNSSYLPNLTQPLVRGFDEQEGTSNNHLKAQHLYILSDDEIKEGDWCIEQEGITQTVDDLDVIIANECNYKKIIATTNSSLFVNQCDGCKANIPIDKNNIHRAKYPSGPMVCQKSKYILPSIPQSFIDKYVSEYNKGNKIEEVVVEYTDYVQCKGEMIWEHSEDDGTRDQVDYYKCNICGDIRKSGATSILSGKRICGKQTQSNILKLIDNTILIKSIKDSWTRDEVIEICKQLNFKFGTATSNELHDWIKNNL